MKAFVFALLCVVAAVQARSADFGGLYRTPAQAGENPWVVHLRVASIPGQGLLSSCVGSLISESWVLTSASCVEGLRFVWIRYGALNPITPELVTESSQFTVNEDGNLALISLNRVTEINENIAPIALADHEDVPASGKFCGYGAESNVLKDEELSCFELAMETDEDGNIVGTGDELPSPYDLGAPIVSDGVQVGVLNSVNENGAVIVNPAKYRDWIESVSGVRV
ncbi:unnamed protein product, partial [Brenthis ino]